MRNGWIKGGLVLVAALIASAISVSTAQATVAFPRLGVLYRIWFARAMDPCTSPDVTVSGPGTNLPTTGCTQANSTTDTTMTMKYARLIIKSSGKMILIGSGFPYGARIKLELTLRATRKNVTNTTNSPSVTFPDVTVDCGNSPFGYNPSPSGILVGTVKLASCLGTTESGLARGNIEVVNAQLINADTGLVFATAGIVR